MLFKLVVCYQCSCCSLLMFECFGIDAVFSSVTPIARTVYILYIALSCMDIILVLFSIVLLCGNERTNVSDLLIGRALKLFANVIFDQVILSILFLTK